MGLEGRHIQIRGIVQGVGFRPFVYQLAQRSGVGGRVRNDSMGVVIDAFGRNDALDSFIQHIELDAPPAARVREIEWVAIPFENESEFAIAASTDADVRNVSIPADLAICDDCLSEIFDPSNRRFHYPFTNCTNCGPRYTIAKDIPYDRAHTTMSRFRMCADCRREYEDPNDRRFHAQPNACAACGPRVFAMTPNGREIETDDPIGFAARSLRAQFIVAVKGLGGFHLACDATSEIAVQRLRERKQREAKPLAVMVRDRAEAERISFLSESERRLLTSVERPIVLLQNKADASQLDGLFLPYTPLHHLLLAAAGRPLIMTSGNRAEEPIAVRNGEAIERLGGIADLFLMHDRDIETRCDDSVVRLIDDAPVVLRRARGYVPHGVNVPQTFHEPLLAVGAHLKNAICLGVGKTAFLGSHIGDLETVETLRSFEQSIGRMKSFVGIEPRVVAHDLHPDYFSTRYAQTLHDVTLVGVQHHHAHIAAVIAEHAIDSPVIGVAYDGTGYGLDGTSWGGEVMIADLTKFRRVATFRPIPLAGGDRAIKQVWRIALALLDDAFDGEPPLDRIPLFNSVAPPTTAAIRNMIANGINAPLARGAGRYFDAFGAFVLGIANARYEGEVAFQWNVIADPNEKGRYPAVIREGLDPWEVDVRPMVKAAVDDLIAGRSAPTISARFHNTLAAVTVELIHAADADLPVALGGGCFQNARLTESITAALRDQQRVFIGREVPPGDGGIALGQAVIANAVAQTRTENLTCVSVSPAK
ncbi:MAG TPA: carbamoyltransferase HypF [Thermoanaerobaculia bacterium]|nr:carbamoyltransferase HypF [Thermoanaerobaculia bacterium]